MSVDDDDPLVNVSPKQALAVEVLLRGGTQQDAAEAAGVSRETVCRWVNHHPGFIAALNQGRHARSVAMWDRVQDLDLKALGILAEGLEAGDLDTALRWLRVRSVRNVGVEPPGPMSAAEVIDARAQARADEVRQDFIDMLAEQDEDPLAIPSIDLDAVYETVANELRGELGLPRVPTAADLLVHWRDEAHVPCSRLVVADNDDTALDLARETTAGGDSDRVADVSPLCAWDLALLLDDLRCGVEFPDVDGIEADDDPFELERLDPAVVTALAKVTDADLRRVPPRWATNPDLVSHFTELEAERILRTLRDTARSLTPTGRIYLWTATRPGGHASGGPDTSPADAA